MQDPLLYGDFENAAARLAGGGGDPMIYKDLHSFDAVRAVFDEVLELYKGMSPDGGIVEYPLAQITMQLIGRKDKFPNELAQLVREAFFQNYDLIRERLAEEEAKVPAKWWIPLPEADKKEYEIMMQEARLELRQRDYYDGDMLSLQRKIRCKLEPDRAECANPVE